MLRGTQLATHIDVHEYIICNAIIYISYNLATFPFI